MIEAIRNAIRYGGDQSLAASRGEGKTKIFERTLLKYTLQGIIKFSVLFAATGSAAQDSLQSIMGEIETNERLRADYPEVCVPVLALENTPNRAHYQLVTGRRHDKGGPEPVLLVRPGDRPPERAGVPFGRRDHCDTRPGRRRPRAQ
jgi:hypothetical protein